MEFMEIKEAWRKEENDTRSNVKRDQPTEYEHCKFTTSNWKSMLFEYITKFIMQ